MSSTTQYSTFKNAPKEELQWTGGARSLSHVQEEQEGAADSPSCCHTLTEYIKWFVFNVLYVCCPCWDASSYFVNEDGNRSDNIDDPSINRDRVRLLQPRDSSLSLASDSSTLERSAARRSNRPKPPPDPKNCGPPSDYHQNIPLKIKTEESSAAVGPPLPPRTNRPPPSSGDDGPRKRAGSTSNPGRSRREQVDLRKVAVSSGKGLPPIFGTNGKRSLSCAQLSSKNDANNDLSSKSGTPSPVIGREIRESSVCSRSSVDTNDEGDVVSRDERFPSPFTKHGSLSNLGVRSESMASVYSQGEGRYGTVVVRGDVEFGIHYRNGALEIAVKQCKDLAAVDIKRNRSDPYVKVYLLPDKSKSGKRKTKVKKHTLNPVFDEILKYQIPLNEVEKRTMWLTVWHSDMFGRNDFLGEVMQPLSGVDLVDTMTRWYNLQDRTEPLSPDDLLPSTTYRGELIVALKFVPSSEIRGKVSKVKGHLQILIKEGKNLVPPKGSNNIDPFCKCYLLPGKGLKQKTTICRRTNKPKWEQTISWDDVTLAELSDRSLEITVWDHDRLGHNEMIGGLRFNNGSGKHQHRFVNWMDSSGKEVTLWQQMLERPNFWVEGSVHLRTAERMTNV
uniref:C2 domain-containing protein n=1 Tax=Lepeophtheirus salmonis TaxID=72036 RepID=A0A0K2TY91_LEPSM